MQGYETKEARSAHIRALVVELEDVRRAVVTAKETLERVPSGQRVEKAQRQEDLARLEKRIPAIEEQLSVFKGESPHKRAVKRGEDPGVEKR